MRRGMSLVEILIAAAVLSTVLLGMAMFQSMNVRVGQTERDRGFAIQKAVQMMEEVLANQTTGGTNDTAGVDALSDADGYSFKLTTDPKVTAPDAAISGNPSSSGRYRYVRQINVSKLPHDKRARFVKISVYLADGGMTATPAQPGKPLATVANIVKGDLQKTLPVQTYDLYLIKIQNIASNWGNIEMLNTALADTLDELKKNNPGLDFRRHVIDKLAFGRDPYYSPYVNTVKALTGPSPDPLDWVYFYPGKLADGSSVLDTDKLTGQRLVDGTRQGALNQGTGSSNLNVSQKSKFSYADQFNHGLRQPEELAKYQAGDEMTLRMLLDAMSEGSLKNAIVVNLHTETLPIPPIRNYSDAARVPLESSTSTVKNTYGVDPNNTGEITSGARARLVTHPRVLNVDTSNSDSFSEGNTVDLWVYPYLTSSHSVEPPSAYRDAQIVIRNIDSGIHKWNSGNTEKSVEVLVNHKVINGSSSTYMEIEHRHSNQSHHNYSSHGGGKHSHTLGNVSNETGYHWSRMWPHGGDTHDGLDDTNFSDLEDMYLEDDPKRINGGSGASKGLQDGDIVIKLKNIPFTNGVLPSPVAGSSFGLSSTHYLHGLNYLPDPLLPTLGYSAPLDNATDVDWLNGSAFPRNTARFRIRFKVKPGQERRIEVLTTIGDEDDLNKHAWPNRTSTYCWVGTGAADKPPYSEQYQFLGDPRHNPYKDVRDDKRYNRAWANFSTNAYTTVSNSYDAFPETSNSASGWNGSGVDFDLPRYFKWYRNAILGSDLVFANVSGWSFYYAGLGGEFSTTTSDKPYTGSLSPVAHNEADWGATTRLIAHASNTSSSWYAKPWLGELYPESEWINWRDKGNLPSSTYHRLAYSSIAAFPSARSMNYSRSKKPGMPGSVAFFNGGQGGATNWVAHTSVPAGSTASATTAGAGLATSFNLPLTASFAAERPFIINSTDATLRPSDYAAGDIGSNAWRTLTEWATPTSPTAYYVKTADTMAAAATLTMRGGSSNTDAGGVVLIGAAPATTIEKSVELSRVIYMSALQGFFDLANPTWSAGGARGDEAVKLLPRIEMQSPAHEDIISGSTSTLTLKVEWTRWNRQAYSPNFTGYDANAYRPKAAIHLKYKPVESSTWHFAADGVPTKLGVYSPTHVLTLSGAGPLYNYNWAIGSLAKGDYNVRIEWFRTRDTAPASDTSYANTHFGSHEIMLTKE